MDSKPTDTRTQASEGARKLAGQIAFHAGIDVITVPTMAALIDAALQELVEALATSKDIANRHGFAGTEAMLGALLEKWTVCL